MYAFVDRPVERLSDAGSFLLHAMRSWIQAAAQRSCPPGALAPAFARVGALAALPNVHRVMADLNLHARQRVAFMPLCCGTIGEDEAVLLQLWRDTRTDPARAQETMALLLETDAVASAFDALLGAVARLADAGLAQVSIAMDAVPGSS